METTIREYTKTLDGDDLHPFLNDFYKIMAHIYLATEQNEKATSTYSKLVKSKEKHYGANAKEVVKPSMKLLDMIL